MGESRIQIVMGAALLLGMVLTGTAAAQVTVTEAWARAIVPGQDSTAAYLKLKSANDAVLKGADSPVGKVEMHEMRMDGNVMRMRQVREVQVPAGKTVEFSPDAYHLMVTGVKKPLVKGDKLPLKLHLMGRDGKAHDIDVQAQVVGIADSAPASSNGGMDGMSGMGAMPAKR